MIFAVVSLDSVLIYDTQHLLPILVVKNAHYASLSDVSWAEDARFLVLCSLDGYVSVVFLPDQLGTRLDPAKEATILQALKQETDLIEAGKSETQKRKVKRAPSALQRQASASSTASAPASSPSPLAASASIAGTPGTPPFAFVPHVHEVQIVRRSSQRPAPGAAPLEEPQKAQHFFMVAEDDEPA